MRVLDWMQCGWYWGAMNFDEAEAMLSNRRDGSFLVRDSSDERYILSLSFRSQGGTHHTRIEHYKGKDDTRSPLLPLLKWTRLPPLDPLTVSAGLDTGEFSPSTQSSVIHSNPTRVHNAHRKGYFLPRRIKHQSRTVLEQSSSHVHCESKTRHPNRVYNFAKY